MKTKHHVRILIFASLVWLFFLILGWPDYYLQYSTGKMIWFTALLLIPITVVIWNVFRPVKQSRRIQISLWYAFYFTIPLAIYDYIYCGIILDYGLRFVYVFWFLSVYYLIPWILFPAVARILNKWKK